jgi:hypothetical protein
MREGALKLPADVRQLLQRRFDSRHRDWLAGGDAAWPLDIALGVPSEGAALAQMDATRAWVHAWQRWQGPGTLHWTERRWRTLGTQRLPESLRLDDARQVALWLDDAQRWDRAVARHASLTARWPALGERLGRLFGVLADYADVDFDRLVAALAWFEAHPASNLYLRQLPIAGLDTKWLETRKGILAELICCITGRVADGDFHALCGLRKPPAQVRMRILDPALRAQVCGIGDLTAPVADLAQAPLQPRHVIIVENLQTGLALGDLPGAVAFMGLGYSIDLLARMPWVRDTDCIYWGDIDTHGFAIVNRARACLHSVRTILMDEQTLLSHRALWTSEPAQHGANELPLLLPEELAVYRGLRQHAWGQAVRLEQERIGWGMAEDALAAALNLR